MIFLFSSPVLTHKISSQWDHWRSGVLMEKLQVYQSQFQEHAFCTVKEMEIVMQTVLVLITSSDAVY